jgi:hypothetical protein
VRGGLSLQREKEVKDRKKWKTLRDFVDERAIEDVLDTIENDRNALDVGALLYSYGKELHLGVCRICWQQQTRTRRT